MQKSIIILLILCFLGTTTSLFGQEREYYQLKIYTFQDEEQVRVTDQYLEHFYLPSLKKQGLSNIGVFKSIVTEDSKELKTYVLIPFSSLDQWASMEKDILESEMGEMGKTYLNATHNQPPYVRIESVIMQAFEDMPQMRVTPVKGKDRIYELRSYESATEQLYRKKVDMFNAGGEIKLFDELNFNAVFYAEVLSGSSMPNLMYMTTFESMESRDAHWKIFLESPTWVELKAMEKYQNTVSSADILLLKPAAYSDY